MPTNMNAPFVLTIAGSDPSSGAGVQADLSVFQYYGIQGKSAITALTAQNPDKVVGYIQTDPVFLKKQIRSVMEYYPVKVVKTGMLCSDEIVRAVYDALEPWIKEIEIVVDPVICSTDGTCLLNRKGINAIKELLFPYTSIITPNVSELAELSDADKNAGSIDLSESANELISKGACSVLVTGGDLKGDAVDVFFDGKTSIEFRKNRLDGKFHGSGCKLSSVIAAFIAKGLSICESVSKAEEEISGVLLKFDSDINFVMKDSGDNND